MRRTIRLAVLLLTLASAGCAAADTGGGVATAGGGASAAPSTPAARDRPLKYSQCMREQGLEWFPDPDPASGTLKIKVPPSVPKAEFDAAMKACKKWSPDGGDNARLNPADLERARLMAQCMRENGVPDFPDPQPDGSIRLDGGKLGIGPDDPAFAAAERLCDRFRPSPPPGGGLDKVGG